MIHTIPEFETIEHGSEIAQSPMPLDQKLVGGIALSGALSTDTVEHVMHRLEATFYLMRNDITRESGAGLAYSIGYLSKEDQAMLDKELVANARMQNHCMRPVELRPTDKADGVLWRGNDPQAHRAFMLRGFQGRIALNNNTMPESNIWSLNSQAL